MSSPCNQFVLQTQPFRSLKEIEDDFEKGNDDKKYNALKEVILMHMSGQGAVGSSVTTGVNTMLMPIIRYVLPSTNKKIKRLLLCYWEIISVKNPEGKMREEVILVVEQLRKDLTHPNEYVRGSVLRMLSKIKEYEILEPLVQPILHNLEDKIAYVRRNAVLCIFSIYRSETLRELVHNAPNLIFETLKKESDLATRRNCFIMLEECAPKLAGEYLRLIIKDEAVDNMGALFQLEILRLLKKLCKKNFNEKHRYLRIISTLINSKDPAVLYQCANSLFELSGANFAVRTAFQCFIRLLLMDTNDSDTKLIVFGRIEILQKKYPNALKSVEMIGELLRVLRNLTSDNIKDKSTIDLKTRLLAMLGDLVTLQNMDEVASTLKFEHNQSLSSSLLLTSKTDIAKSQSYRKLIIKCFHQIFNLFLECPKDENGNFVDICISQDLNNFVNNNNNNSNKNTFSNKLEGFIKCLLNLCDHLDDVCALDSISLIRDVLALLKSTDKEGELKASLLNHLISNISIITDENVIRDAFWIIMEHSSSISDVVFSLESIFKELNHMFPIAPKEKPDNIANKDQKKDEKKDEKVINKLKNALSEDGTYKVNVVDEKDKAKIKSDVKASNNKEVVSNLGKILTDLDKSHYLASVLCQTLGNLIAKLTKLISEEGEKENLQNREELEKLKKKRNFFKAKACVVIVKILKEGGESLDKDSKDRISKILNLLTKGDNLESLLVKLGDYKKVLMKEKEAFFNSGSKLNESSPNNKKNKDEGFFVNVSQLRTKSYDVFAEEDNSSDNSNNDDNYIPTDDSGSSLFGDSKNSNNKLTKVVQLTGCSDPIYAETSVTINQFDIMLNILMVNQTKNILENIAVELNASGDMEINDTYDLFNSPSSNNRIVDNSNVGNGIKLLPGEQTRMRMSVKVTSTDTGSIMGNISYTAKDPSSSDEGSMFYIVLNSININVMDYIGNNNNNFYNIITEDNFRTMWKEFEWENKMTINYSPKSDTKCTLVEFLDLIMKSSNTTLLNNFNEINSNDDFLSANLYTRSIFNEDALVNVSIQYSSKEKGKESDINAKNCISGVIRIRAKNKGIAKSIGKAIKASQRSHNH